jgi:hypothetical protein
MSPNNELKVKANVVIIADTLDSKQADPGIQQDPETPTDEVIDYQDASSQTYAHLHHP